MDATARMISGLASSPRAYEPISIATEQAGAVETASDRFLSRTTSSGSLPTDNFGGTSFVYDGVRAGQDIRAGLSRRRAALTPLPMEDIFFHVKEIDNTARRRPRVDPADKSMVGRFVVLGVAAVVFCLIAFGPTAGLRRSGYRLQSLNRQHQMLLEDNRQLKMRQAMLSNVRRVTTLAETRGLAAPPPGRYTWHQRAAPPVSDGSKLARNHPVPRP